MKRFHLEQSKRLCNLIPLITNRIFANVQRRKSALMLLFSIILSVGTGCATSPKGESLVQKIQAAAQADTDNLLPSANTLEPLFSGDSVTNTNSVTNTDKARDTENSDQPNSKNKTAVIDEAASNPSDLNTNNAAPTEFDKTLQDDGNTNVLDNTTNNSENLSTESAKVDSTNSNTKQNQISGEELEATETLDTKNIDTEAEDGTQAPSTSSNANTKIITTEGNTTEGNSAENNVDDIAENAIITDTQPIADTNTKNWWTQFEDDTLNQLLADTLNDAFDLRTAAARLAIAAGQSRSSHAGLLPTLSFDANGSITDDDIERNDFRTPNQSHSLSLDLTAQWQTDLLGRLFAIHKADDKRLLAAEALSTDTQRVLLQNVMVRYFELRAVQRLKVLAQESVTRRTENARRINRLVEKRYATSLDKNRTDSQLYEAKAELATQAISEVQLINTLALLTGLPLADARARLIDTVPLPIIPTKVPTPTPADLIQHRPDLRAAEYDLEAAAYALNAAKAAKYPSLNFGIQLTKSGTDLENWPSLNPSIGSVFAGLTQPLLGRGRILAQIDIEDANLQLAHIRYEQAILALLADIDSTLVAVVRNRDIHQNRVLAAESSSAAAKDSHRLFKSGEIEYTSVIVAEQTRTSAERLATLAHRDTIIAYTRYLTAVVPAW